MTALRTRGSWGRCGGALGVVPLMALAACTAGTGTQAVSPPAPSEISYETSPCFGTCPVYSVTVRSTGEGVFEGKRFTAVEGRRAFTVDPQTYAAFARRLAGARAADPAAHVPGGAACREQATDHPSVTVTFRDGTAAPRVFPFYYGCRDAMNSTLGTTLRDAPKTLPIAGFIGAR